MSYLQSQRGSIPVTDFLFIFSEICRNQKAGDTRLFQCVDSSVSHPSCPPAHLSTQGTECVRWHRAIALAFPHLSDPCERRDWTGHRSPPCRQPNETLPRALPPTPVQLSPPQHRVSRGLPGPSSRYLQRVLLKEDLYPENTLHVAACA